MLYYFKKVEHQLIKVSVQDRNTCLLQFINSTGSIDKQYENVSVEIVTNDFKLKNFIKGCYE